MGGGLAEPRGQIYQIVMSDTNGRVGGGRHLPANADRSTIGPMKQIRFELPPGLFEEANRVARVQGISFAAVVTQGLELLLDGYPDEPRASQGPTRRLDERPRRRSDGLIDRRTNSEG